MGVDSIAKLPGIAPVRVGVADDATPPARRLSAWFRPGPVILALGATAIATPTLVDVARLTWNSETGAHAPIVLLTGCWLLGRGLADAMRFAVPPPAWRAFAAFASCCLLFMASRLTHVVELEGYLMYATLGAAAYGLVGARPLRRLAFPIVYLAFLFPPPETVVYAITMPMKIAISEAAVNLLYLFGLPIGGTGVTIQIGPYQLLVAAACSGLNSIVTLAALTTFYIYVRYAEDLRYAGLLLLFVIPIALLVNFARVLLLILLTYYAGENIAQGFAHTLAGMTMFVLALACIFGVDTMLLALREWLSGRSTAASGKPA